MKKKQAETKLHIDSFVFAIIALVSFLIYVHFQINTEISSRKHIIACHEEALMSSQAIYEENRDINDVELYEFMFKTCVRELGFNI